MSLVGCRGYGEVIVMPSLPSPATDWEPLAAQRGSIQESTDTKANGSISSRRCPLLSHVGPSRHLSLPMPLFHELSQKGKELGPRPIFSHRASAGSANRRQPEIALVGLFTPPLEPKIFRRLILALQASKQIIISVALEAPGAPDYAMAIPTALASMESPVEH
ncbi:hypothetical protein NM208_g16951 [Fusarium decemcellulare]|uniref:Uncharacterized protein n=1 Tax=Fusarium decemcellulare TaxID=57161 RepID=A0ACC1RC60_9HYPO|nr:hypothetical protein NM208_g16951 [Fusarium decemcellulare]